MSDKPQMRAKMRAARRATVAALPGAVHRLILLRPPAPIARLTAGAAMIGLYHAARHEAPTRGYANWYHEHGHGIALPWFADRNAAMQFRRWRDPYDDAALEPGPWGVLQPPGDAPPAEPDMVFVPLLGFTRQGDRLGQGGGHYDRWLSAHPRIMALGLAWDCQLLDNLPQEPHDRAMRAVITPTCIYGDPA